MDVLNFENIGEIEMRHRLKRGDYIDPEEIAVVGKWLQSKEREAAFLLKCESASVAAALNASRAASRANFIALLSLVTSILVNHHQIRSFIEMVMSIK